MGLIIAFEGIIGISKSTQCKLFAKRHNFKFFEEPADIDPRFKWYLDKFYQDPKRWALEFQYFTVGLRKDIENQASDCVKATNRAAILDRTRRGDRVFAHIQFLKGNISPIGYDAYIALNKRESAEVEKGMVFIYLKTSIETCFERIKHRSREAEIKCDPDFWIPYLTELDGQYDIEMTEAEREGLNVIKVDASSNDPMKISKNIDQLLYEKDPRWREGWDGWAVREHENTSKMRNCS